jgi:restriction system protein
VRLCKTRPSLFWLLPCFFGSFFGSSATAGGATLPVALRCILAVLESWEQDQDSAPRIIPMSDEDKAPRQPVPPPQPIIATSNDAELIAAMQEEMRRRAVITRGPDQPPFVPPPPIIFSHDGSTDAAMIAAHEAQRRAQYRASASSTSFVPPPEEQGFPPILIQAEIVVFGDRTEEGQLVKNVGVLWFEILNRLKADPEFWFKLNWRELEELVAGAYVRQGCSRVEVTPRSNDGGVDVIATFETGQIKIYDQVKHHQKRGKLVDANDVRALIGVLNLKGNVSKGIITTTTDFAPGVYKDEEVQRLIPYRLQTKNGTQLLSWLSSLVEKP